MSISFNEIPVTLRTPGQFAEFDNSKAVRGLVLDMSRILVIGQKVTAGTATANVAVQCLSADQAVELAGRGSMLAEMVRALKNVNAHTDCWILPLADNGAGVAATGTISTTGPATGAGTINLYIGGKRVQVGVASGDTAAEVATAIAAAIEADDDLLIGAAVDGGTDTQVNLTCIHKGEVGNGIDLRVNYHAGEKLPAGVGVTIVAMADGASNPALTTALTNLGDTQFHYVVNPYADATSLGALSDEFEDRWDGTRQIEGLIFGSGRGNHAALTTLGGTRNSHVESLIGAYASPTPPHVWAAVYGGVAAFHLDIDPARPLQTLELKGVLPPAESVRFTREERNLLLYAGIATYLVTQDGRVLIERAVTTYQTNAYSLPDPSYLDVNTPATLAVLRRTLRARIAQRYPRHKLASDGTNFGPGQAIVTPSILRGELIALAREWEQVGWVENLDEFKALLLVERDASDQNRVNALLPPDLVNQLRVFAAVVQFRV